MGSGGGAVDSSWRRGVQRSTSRPSSSSSVMSARRVVPNPVGRSPTNVILSGRASNFSALAPPRMMPPGDSSEIPPRSLRNTQPPVIAPAIIVGEFPLDQSGAPPNRGEMRLRTLDRFLDAPCGADGQQSSARRLKKPDDGECGDDKCYDDLEQGEPAVLSGAFSGHWRCLSDRSASRRRRRCGVVHQSARFYLPLSCHRG